MPSRKSPVTPAYRLNKTTGRAVVTLNGVDHYLGRYGSAESRAEYDRIIAEWLARGRHLSGSDLTIQEVIVAYLRFADGYYRKPDGRPTKEPLDIRQALRPLRKLYGSTVAAEF